MAYDFNKYLKEYKKKNIANVSLKLHRTYDADIIEFLEGKNKQDTIKKLIRKEISNK